MRFAKFFTLGGLLALLALTTFFSSYTIISPGSRGIYLVLGKAQDEVLTEGFHFKYPWISSIQKISIRVQKTEEVAEAASKDMQKVGAKFALNWHVNPDNVILLFRSVGDEDEIAERVIQPATSEVLKAATSRFTAEEILTHRIELKGMIDEMLISRLRNYNIIVDDISLVDLDFTKEFNHSVEQKQIAEQEAKQALYNAQRAEADATSTVNTARGAARSLLLTAKAQAEAQQLLRSSLTPAILQMEYLKKWNGQLPSVLSGASSLMFNMSLPSTSAKGESNE